MGNRRFGMPKRLSLLTTKRVRIYLYRWKFLRLTGFESHPLRHSAAIPFFSTRLCTVHRARHRPLRMALSRPTLGLPSAVRFKDKRRSLFPRGRWNDDVVGWHECIHRDMRPSELIEIQQHGLGVLNLCKANSQFPRFLRIDRRDAGKRRHALPLNAALASDGKVLTDVKRWNMDLLFHGFDPENGEHLQGLCVRCVGGRLSHQKCNIVHAAAEWQ